MRTRPLRTATPKSAMKPTPAEIENGSPRAEQRADPADDGERDIEEDHERRAPRAERQPEQEEDERQRDRNDDEEPRPRLDVVLELPAPLRSIADGEADVGGDGALGLTDDGEEIPTADVELDGEPARLTLAADLRRARGELDLGHVPERHDLPRDRSKRQRPERSDSPLHP